MFRAAGSAGRRSKRSSPRGEDLGQRPRRVRRELGRAVVVKPHAQGSAIGVTRIDARGADDELARALELALSFDERRALRALRRRARGDVRRPRCAALGETRALPPDRDRRQAGRLLRFRIALRHGRQRAHRAPPSFAAAVSPQGASRSRSRAHRALGCRDLSRADFVVGDGDDPTRSRCSRSTRSPG